jgi:glycosyltransferase involved in cell wall biosynthesis
VSPPTNATTTLLPAPPVAREARPGTRVLRVGIDARAAAEVPAGRGRVVRELLRVLAEREDEGRQRYLLYARCAWRDESREPLSSGEHPRRFGQPLDERFQWREIPARDPIWHVRAARAADRECDVFLSTNSYLTSGLLHIPCVSVVHDLATFDHALRPNRRSAAIERLTLGPAVRRSAALLAISEATAQALVERFPTAATRTVVAPLGVASAFAASPHSLAATHGPHVAASYPFTAPPEPLDPVLDPAEAAALPRAGFVLAVGTLEPRKNLPRLVEAYRRLEQSLTDRHPLVVVGARGWQTGETLRALRSLGGSCTLLGHVSDAALAELYRRCAVFCYPSLGEGFGLPVLEAMAAGAAVLTSSVSSLPEVGGEAVEYVDPLDVSSIATGLERLLGDEPYRVELGRRARERAGKFTWEGFAERVLEVLGAAANGGLKTRSQ